MKEFSNSKTIIFIFLISITTDILFCLQNYSTYTVNLNRGQYELDMMEIKTNDKICSILIPSLFSQILLIPIFSDVSGFDSLDYECNLKFPIYEESFRIRLYYYSFLDKYNDFVIGKPKVNNIIENCFFGLSYGNDSIGIDEKYFLLNQFYNRNQIKEKIFSFDKWTINENSIITNFYFGDRHENFRSNKGIIGTCKNDGYPYWGCSFHEMIFNNNYSISLEYEDGKYYKIYFSTETNNITFPEVFGDLFNYFTKGKCKSNEIEKSLYCNDMLNEEGYIPLKLINENMSITAEIDSQSRFTTSSYERNNTKTRIYFKDINYIILPLIMFKQFHIQFDASKGIISFYTTDKSILEIKNKKKGSNNNSSALIITLSIIIVVVILIIGYVIFRILRKRKESNIQNDAKKIEEIEEFHSMK